ncbi:MAG: hypothetical protein ACYTKC_21725, partial [Planctomycetota bacterium]|jgi:hypothetical protein
MLEVVMSARVLTTVGAVTVLTGWAFLAAEIVPNEVQQPGTQPNEVGSLESPDKCDNCHGGYSQSVEPDFNWRGSMMANAGRDPLFWATVAVAEQDFEGAGDLCIRCHSPAGWSDGRSTPTDGSALMDKDADGVQCDLCHAMTDPDGSEHVGVQNAPFGAYDEGSGEAYYGSGMYVLWSGSSKLGPYPDAEARHQFMQSVFHREGDFCGTCHDVSNPVVGDLAHNNGVPGTADHTVVFSGVPGADVSAKAAFNNLPFQYGVVERTFSEFKSGAIHATRVADYPSLPADLRGGALQAGYESALSAGTGGDYEDGTPRYYTCQTCHMRPVVGAGCNKQGAPQRNDLPLHDMTGGNYWIADAIQWQDQRGLLRLGGGLTSTQNAALDAGQTRALKQLNQAAGLSVSDNTVKVVNRTGHKLISGYPEGRRMWLNIKWYDDTETLVREDGKYGELTVDVDGVPTQVRSLLDLHDPNTRIYEAHYGMTQAWAQQLLDLGYAPDMALTFDRHTGSVAETLSDLAGAPEGSDLETFHFVLNNRVIKDNRIPPYRMSYTEARQRNALPVPATQYGNPTDGGVYDYFDQFALSPPAGAVYATIDLLYQPTSREYIHFLYLANQGLNAFLGDEGANLLDAWMNTGMAEPYAMASTTWGSAPTPAVPTMSTSSLATWCVGKGGSFTQPCDSFGDRTTMGWVVGVVDDAGAPVSGAQVFTEIRDGGGSLVTEKQGFTDETGGAGLTWKIPRRQATGPYVVSVVNIIHGSYEFAAGGGAQVSFTIQ